ncbi:type III pantothenate kinase [Bacteroidia bacterium]|nr:type III pantothenate kinase [Bacteroidia bacterium]
MNLCIDIGNSSSKVGIFDNRELKHFFLFKTIIKKDEIVQICNKFAVSACILSSTVKSDFKLINFLKEKIPFFIELTHKTPIPITNCYKTPETLGKDRLAAVAGAVFLQPGNDTLVVDAGTAITFDFIDKEKKYRGGTISPGLAMRFRALNEFTGRLPLLQIADNENIELTGNDTRTAILNGVVNGILFETDSYITAFKEKFPALSVFLTGGNANYLAKRLKNFALIENSLVLIGLNCILEFNMQKYKF